MAKKQSSTAERVITQRELNRALLARQLLIARVSMPALQAVEVLAGMQAQNPLGIYVSLWSRLVGFERDELARLIEQRQIVKSTLLRGTLHFYSADDYVRFRHTLQPMLSALTGSYARSHHLSVSFDEIVSAARQLFSEGAHTFADLAALLTGLYPDEDRITLTNVVRGMLPIVQVPVSDKRWSYPPNVKWVLAEDWIGRPLDQGDYLRDLVWRYLAAFGPATVADIRAWSGLPDLKARLAPLKADLVIYRDEQGRELLDLPDLPIPEADTPVAVRFLGDLDNLLLAHHDRSRVMSELYRLLTVSARFQGRAILVDGFLRGSWLIDKKQPGLLMIQPFAPVSAPDQAALIEEGERLIRFIAPEAAAFDVQFLNVTEQPTW